MSAQKFLTVVLGEVTEKQAIESSAGAGDEGKLTALDATGRLDASFMPVGIVPEITLAVAFENLSAGDFVNLFLSGGVIKARKADATTTGKEANGFVLAAFLTGAVATMYNQDSNNQRAGLTIGSTYFLDTVAGGVNLVAPTGSGNIVQKVGKATSATAILVKFSNTITLA